MTEQEDGGAADVFIISALSPGYLLPFQQQNIPPRPTLDAQVADGCTRSGSFFTVGKSAPYYNRSALDWLSSGPIYRLSGRGTMDLFVSVIDRAHREGGKGMRAIRCATSVDCQGYVVQSNQWRWSIAAQFSPRDSQLLAVLAETFDTVVTDKGQNRYEQGVFVHNVSAMNWSRPASPADMSRYASLDTAQSSYQIGRGRDEQDWLMTKMLYSPDGSELLVLGFNGADNYSTGALIRIDAATMKEIAPSIPVNTQYAQFGNLLERPSVWRNYVVTNIDIHPDGRFLVFNRWETASIGVIDLDSGESWVVQIPGFVPDDDYLVMDGHAVANMAFNKTDINRGLLAIHGLDRIGIYALSADGHALEQRSLLHTSRTIEYVSDGPGGARIQGSQSAAIDWSGDGRFIIAAGASIGPEEVRSWRIVDSGRRMTDQVSYEACAIGSNYVEDIFTLNGLLPTATPTASRTGDPSQTTTPTLTPRPTFVPSSTASLTVTAESSPEPFRAFLPLLLGEECIVESKRLDVVLVIDASSSMAEEAGDGSGQTKLDVAENAALTLVDELRLDLGAASAGVAGDRAGIVSFNADAGLLQELTHDRRRIELAVQSISLLPDTRLDLGIKTAMQELTGIRRRIGATRVMIVLTDGRATGGPQQAIESAEIAKAIDITVFTIGMGSNLDQEALQRIASRREYCQILPTAIDLVSVFKRIGHDLPCPPWTLWGGR